MRYCRPLLMACCLSASSRPSARPVLTPIGVLLRRSPLERAPTPGRLYPISPTPSKPLVEAAVSRRGERDPMRPRTGERERIFTTIVSTSAKRQTDRQTDRPDADGGDQTVVVGAMNGIVVYVALSRSLSCLSLYACCSFSLYLSLFVAFDFGVHLP